MDETVFNTNSAKEKYRRKGTFKFGGELSLSFHTQTTLPLIKQQRKALYDHGNRGVWYKAFVQLWQHCTEHASRGTSAVQAEGGTGGGGQGRRGTLRQSYRWFR